MGILQDQSLESISFEALINGKLLSLLIKFTPGFKAEGKAA